MNHQLQQYLADKQRQGLYRTRQLTSAGCLNFSCNDYLSLSLDARVLQAYQTGFQLYPAGSGGSMVLFIEWAAPQLDMRMDLRNTGSRVILLKTQRII